MYVVEKRNLESKEIILISFKIFLNYITPKITPKKKIKKTLKINYNLSDTHINYTVITYVSASCTAIIITHS